MDHLTELRDEIADLENVDDVEEDVVVTSNLFSISSFGIDYPIETLVRRMDKDLSLPI